MRLGGAGPRRRPAAAARGWVRLGPLVGRRLAQHVLAVAGDVVLEVGEDRVVAGAAGDPILAPVAGVDHVVAGTGIARVGLAASALRPDPVVAFAAQDRVRPAAA